MKNELVKSKAEMSFHLDGDNEIDAILLSKMINDTVELTKLVSRKVDPDAYLKMNITAFKNGSFEIDFSAICQVAESLFIALGAAATTAGTIIGAVKGAIELKKSLKGKKEKSIKELPDGSVEVENANGEKITVPNASQIVIRDIKADQLVTNISYYVGEHNPNGGFTVSDKDGSVYCSANDIIHMSRQADIGEETICRRSNVQAELIIRKPDFEGRSKWGFIYLDKKIEASIEDDDFLAWFKDHSTVSRGDHINVTLEIYVDLDISGEPVKGTEKYSIKKVYGHIMHENEQYEMEI